MRSHVLNGAFPCDMIVPLSRRGSVTHELDLKMERKSNASDARTEPFFFPDLSEAQPGIPARKATKARSVPVRPDCKVAEAAEMIVKSCIAHFRVNGPLVLQGKAAALHQMRVSMRRLRAALSLFRPAMADPQFDILRQELRWFTGQLGEARNLDVFLTQKGLPNQIRAAVKTERQRAYDRVIAALQSDRLRLLQLDLIAWVELGRWRQSPKASKPLPDFVSRRLYKWWQKIAHHGDLKSMHAHERHELRIEIKKLRYGLEFTRPLHAIAGGKSKQFYKSVERLQESLGRLNDLVTARALWRKFGHKFPRSKNQDREIQRECLQSAQVSLDRLKKMGPYWTRLA